MAHHRWKELCSAIVMTLAVMMVAAPLPVDASDVRLFRIGTGGKTGVYYPIGKLVAQGITGSGGGGAADGAGVPGLIGVAQNSAGSIENATKVAAGDIEAGLVQADIAYWASQGERVFEGNAAARDVRGIASLYPEKFQIVVRRDAGIRTFSDLRGKRISVDEIGSGTLATMRIVLEAHGMSEQDIQPVYLKPVFTHDKMMRGTLQGFVMMAGAPMAAVTQLMKAGVSLVPIADKPIETINARYPYLVGGAVGAGVYPGIPETQTIQVYALLVVNARMPDRLAYDITAALWSPRTRELLVNGHPQGAAITPTTALAGMSIPLHPGARKYYREHAARFPGNPGP